MKPCTLCWLAALLAGLASAQDRNPPGWTPPTFGTTVVLAAGLHGIVYFIPKDTWVLPDFDDASLERVGDIWTTSLNIPPRHWRAGFPGLTDRDEWFAIDYTGKFWVEQPARYTFALVSDDGSRLFIDDTPVIDDDCQHPPDLRIAAVKLEGGGHRIRVTYFQGPRDCLALLLAVAGPDHRWQVFSTTNFKPPSNPDDWRFPAANAMTIVPTNPSEASLTVRALLQLLKNTDPAEAFVISSESGKGCRAWAPVRTCGK